MELLGEGHGKLSRNEEEKVQTLGECRAFEKFLSIW